jgi:hypothetical protein
MGLNSLDADNYRRASTARSEGTWNAYWFVYKFKKSMQYFISQMRTKIVRYVRPLAFGGTGDIHALRWCLQSFPFKKPSENYVYN